MLSDKSKIATLFAFILLVFPLLSSMLSLSSSYSQEGENSILSSPDTGSGIVVLNISDITVEESATGLTSVIGVVQNNSTENVVNIKINITLSDSENSIIRDTNRFVSGPFTVYQPNSTESFSFLMSAEEFDNYVAKAYAEWAP